VITPKVHLVAFMDRDPAFIFVGVPDERGRYLRTDTSVALVECPQCKAMVGEPCIGGHGYGGSTHVARRRAKSAAFGSRVGAEDVITIESEAA